MTSMLADGLRQPSRLRMRQPPPVLRLLYGYCRSVGGSDVAVVLLGGDKSTLGSLWYRTNINEAEARLDQYCRKYDQLMPIVKRGNR